MVGDGQSGGHHLINYLPTLISRIRARKQEASPV